MKKFFLSALLVTGLAFVSNAQSSDQKSADPNAPQTTVVSADVEPGSKACCKSGKEKVTAAAGKKLCCKDGKSSPSCGDKKSSAAIKESNETPLEHSH